MVAFYTQYIVVSAIPTWCELGLGTVHIWTGTSTGIGTWNSVPVPNGTFFRYFTLCVITKTFISVKKKSEKVQNSQFQHFEQ